ncbi:miaB family protein possibly involved in tRNA or rRNA modification [Clostridium sp. CAG:798]|jgi:MiaB-like protein|nr:miaB family protein possibly involved in tRNA or rRNA modification [Clostridium sp. CAG:798]
MTQKFIEKGYEVVQVEEKADVYIINTCTVTNMADRKSRQMLRRVKQINPNSVVVATGCYAQVSKDELEQIEDIDLVLGINEKNNIVEYVNGYLNTRTKYSETSDVLHQSDFLDFGTVTHMEKTRAVIKVQDGCDRFCSYCIIPYARGRVRSRLPESIINEITQIANAGIKEVVITGIHIASYGKDFRNNYKLIDLLEEINKIEGIKRIRLGSIEPTLITEEFVNRLSKLEKICDHFHLSLQSGCDATLERMNRKYTTEEFEKVVVLLRKYYKNVALTTDIIVGFPEETNEEFVQTYNYLNKIDFYKMHIFKYSPRKGTKAALMKNQVPGDIKEERSKKLIELSDKNQKEHNEKYIGQKLEVLFEEREKEYIKGHTTNYIVVKTKTDKQIENTIQTVKITGEENLELIGEHISGQQ